MSNKLSLSYNLLSANKKASTPFSRMNFFHGPAFRRILIYRVKAFKTEAKYASRLETVQPTAYEMDIVNSRYRVSLIFKASK